MGKALRKREEQVEERNRKFDASLSAPRVVPTFSVEDILAKVMKDFEGFVIRDPKGFDPNLRTKDKGKIALAAARYLFARYQVADHIEEVWREDFINKPRVQGQDLTRKLAYLTVAQGGSLYKDYTASFLSKKETHFFLTAPAGVTWDEAIWYAIARGHNGNHGDSLKISKCKLTAKAVKPFWKDAVRFFVMYPTTLSEMNDLIDYMAYRLNENSNFTLKGRNLVSLRAQMIDWHHDLARAKRIGGGSWIGLDEPDFTYVVEGSEPSRTVTWTIRQIKTGDALAAEGNAMRHCVASYKYLCTNGRCSIWSVRKSMWGMEERALTVEIDNLQRQIVQVRGYANRAAKDSERHILNQWVRSSELNWSRRLY